MILSNGQHVELKSLDDGTLIKEERTFFNMYKNSKREKIKGKIKR